MVGGSCGPELRYVHVGRIAQTMQSMEKRPLPVIGVVVNVAQTSGA